MASDGRTVGRIEGPGHRSPVHNPLARLTLNARTDRAAFAAVALAVATAIVAPVAEIVLRSFEKQTGLFTSTASLANYERLLSPDMVSSGSATFIIAAGSALLATVLGTILALVVARTDVPGWKWLELLAYVPFFWTPMISGIAWAYLAAPDTGILNHLAVATGVFREGPFNAYTLPAIIFVLGLSWVPIVMLLTIGTLRQADPALEHASRACGAGPFRTFWRVTLPLAIPAVSSAAVLVFVLSVDEFGVPIILGYPYGTQTLSTRLYDTVLQSFPPNYNLAAAIGTVMVAVALVAFYLQHRLVRGRSFVTVSGRNAGAQRIRLGGWRWLAFALAVAYVALAVVLPLCALAIAAISARWTGTIDLRYFTTENFRLLFTADPLAQTALVNSMFLAPVAATVGIALALAAAYGTQRLRFRGARLVDLLLGIPIAVPGMALAVGILDLLIRTPAYATLAIIGLAYVVRYFPYGHQTVVSAFGGLHPELEEAAQVSGGGRVRTLRAVLLPLVRPSLLSGWLLLCIMFLREVSMSNILWNNGTQVLSVALLDAVEFQPAGVAAAFTLVQVAVILVPMLLILRIGGRDALYASSSR